jgi:hypothetical protein
MSKINIRIEVNVYPATKNVDRIMQRLINRNFKEVLEDSESYEFPLDEDPKTVGEDLLDNLVSYTFEDETSPFWGKKTRDEIREYIISSGVNSDVLVNWIKNTLLTSNPSSAIKKIFTLDPKIKKIIEKGQEYLSKYGHGIDIRDIDTIENLNAGRTMVVRSQFGDYGVLAYQIPGGSIKSNDSRISHIKSLYRYETGCPYYQARPILYSTWVNLSEEEQVQTSF